jgi:hypothetical protein
MSDMVLALEQDPDDAPEVPKMLAVVETGPVHTSWSGGTNYFATIRDATSPAQISDEQVAAIAQAVAAQAEAERPRQRRREWKLIVVSLIAGALLSVPIGILVNLIS